ncbi:hypothetical protein TNCV_35911 [Trichonephila clavipes]|nr:hypothetical protein TNCV_35911 [Trichonephila clavipes]
MIYECSVDQPLNGHVEYLENAFDGEFTAKSISLAFYSGLFAYGGCQLCGSRSWLSAGLIFSSLRVRSRPKSVDFHEAKNRQCPCCMIMRHVKNP